MSAQPNLLHVPLSQLQLSIHNARKTGGTDISDLAASIEAHGLMQNLSVVPSANDPERFEVIAGGRRLSALKLLQDQGRLDKQFLVPIRLIANEAALEASTAENTIREAMHPADQFVAFKGMVDAHKSIEEVAAHFGVAVSVVKQRLKLANVHPKLVERYRVGEMKLEQLQALALTDDHDLQLKAWNVKDDWMRRADQIKKVITKKEIGPDNPLVKFVEPALYESAGGQVRRDMFSNDVYYSDERLLQTLAKNKIDALALKEELAGWSWVATHLVLDYSSENSYGHSTFNPKREKPTPEDLQRTSEIEVRLKAIEAIELASEMELDDALQDEQEALEAELELIKGRQEVWPAEAKAKTGVLIYIDQYQGLKISRGRLKPGQREGTPAKGKTKDGKPAKAALSQDMVQRLEMHRAAAIRAHVAADPDKALQLLLAHLLTTLLTTTERYGETTLDIRPESQHRNAKGLIDSKFSDLAKSGARKRLDDRLADWKAAGLPNKGSDIFGWLGKQSPDKRLELLALATALTLNTNTGTRGAALAVTFGVDMQQWWTASPETYIGVVPKALLAEAVADIGGKAAGEAVLAMKKDAAMAEAAKALAGTGWLPKPLRAADYKLLKPGSAKAAPAPAVVKKVAAKKAETPAAKAIKTATKKPAKKAAKSAPKKAAKK